MYECICCMTVQLSFDLKMDVVIIPGRWRKLQTYHNQYWSEAKQGNWGSWENYLKENAFFDVSGVSGIGWPLAFLTFVEHFISTFAATALDLLDYLDWLY